MSNLQPVLPGVLVLLTLAVVIAGRWRRSSRVVTALATAILFVWSWPPTVGLLASTLEGWYQTDPSVEGVAEAIVVLSASVRPATDSRPEPLLGPNTTVRTMYAAWLHHNWKRLPILTSGGALGPPGHRAVVADVMKEALVARGVPADLVWTEDESQSTYQNAVNSAGFLRQRGIQRIVLVTEGYHMPRAERCFRKQGLQVIPAPCGFLREPIRSWTELVPTAKAIDNNEKILHEWIALAVYRLRGWI